LQPSPIGASTPRGFLRRAPVSTRAPFQREAQPAPQLCGDFSRQTRPLRTSIKGRGPSWTAPSAPRDSLRRPGVSLGVSTHRTHLRLARPQPAWRPAPSSGLACSLETQGRTGGRPLKRRFRRARPGLSRRAFGERRFETLVSYPTHKKQAREGVSSRSDDTDDDNATTRERLLLPSAHTRRPNT
jgi:hypothetical protein